MDDHIFLRGKEKNTGIELFRIVSMIMIVILHINMCGGLMGCFGIVDSKYVTLWFGESSCFCCVDCFALISGYVMFGRKLKAKRIVGIWLQVFSISAVIASIWLKWFSEGVEITKITDCYMPLLKSQYWYFTAYFGMLFFVPMLNAAVENTDKKLLKKCLIIILFLFNVVSTFDRKDLFRHSNGMGTFWLCVMYMVGAYFAKNGINTKKYSIKKSGIYAFVTAVVLTVWIVIYSYNVGVETGRVTGQFDWLYYTNPLVVIQSIFMLMFFAQIKINNNMAKKIIFFLSASSFSVYLIHVNPLIFDLVFHSSFIWLNEYNFIVMGILVVICAIGVYLVCTVLDKIRLLLFRFLGLNQLVDFVGEKADKAIDWLFSFL